MNDSSILGLLVLVLFAAAAVAVAAVVGRALGLAQGRQREADLRADLARTEADAAEELARVREELARSDGRLQTENAQRVAAQRDLEWQREQNGALEKRMAPLKSAFDDLARSLKESDAASLKSQTELQSKVTQMARDFGQATADVRTEARKLSTVLSRSDRRGAWGEMQLRTLVESSGMLPHVHYVEQDHTATDTGALRPDLVISLAGDRCVIVDSKVPLEAFLRMSDQTDDDPGTLLEHGRMVHQHILRLSEKAYWKRYNSPEFVIMFLPSEGLLSAALEARPDLIQTGLDRKVLLATPATLMAMLHTISHSWQQVQAADKAREIYGLASEYYERMIGMADKFDKLRRSLDRSVKDFNGLVGTVETRVLPTGRKFQKLGIPGAEIPGLETVDEPLRALSETAWPQAVEEGSPTGEAPAGTDWAVTEAGLLDSEIDLTDPQEPPQANPGDSSAA